MMVELQLVVQSGDTDIAQDDVLGSIFFQAQLKQLVLMQY